MAKIFIAWELGGGLNHIARAAALARGFAALGDQVFVALNSLRHSGLMAWPDGTLLLQAPIASGTHALPDVSNHAEILFSCGYHDAASLASMVVGWSSLIDLVEPDVLIADHAPTASLVARLAEVPLVRMGSGFFAPPAMTPFPVFRTWKTADIERLKTVEERVLSAINSVAQTCSRKFDRVAQAIQPDLDLVTCWPELDHYAGMRDANTVEFIGPERITTDGAALAWPSMGGPRILAYLHAGYSGFGRVFQGLCQTDAATVAFILGDSPATLPPADPKRVAIRRQLFDPWAALESCDVLVCHANNGMVATALEAGKPVLMLPYTTEQFIYADRVQQTGAGLRLDEAQVSADFESHLQAFLSSPIYGEKARALAAKHGCRGDAIPRAVNKIRALIATNQRSA
jgi:UDP:flavonoid glycosyltransferase YjiC (YdhE family)